MTAVATGAQPHAADPALRTVVEDFLFAEADLLDDWNLREWLTLFADDGRYLVPTTDAPDADPARDLFLVSDDRFLLEHRVTGLLTRSAHAEYPHSRTRRLITNVRAGRRNDSRLWATANFAIYRIRLDTVDCYVGRYHLVLDEGPEGLRFVERRAVLDLESLRPQGKVSIIL